MGHNWANGFARAPETAVVAVFDKGQETRDEFRSVWRDTWGEVPGYDDYDTMLAETRPDIVCVTTRQTMHADQIEAAVAAGVRGIACEKPLAPSLEDADRIFAACRSKGVPLAYLLDRRWTAKQLATRNLIAGGAIGDVTSVVGYGASNLINHGCHWYDMALALAGDAEPVWTSGEVIDVSDDPPDSRRPMDPPGRSMTQLANGASMHTLPDGAGLSFHVTGSEGGLLARGDFNSVVYWRDDEDGQTALELPADEVEWPAGPDACGLSRSRGGTSRSSDPPCGGPRGRGGQRRHDGVRRERGAEGHGDRLCRAPVAPGGWREGGPAGVGPGPAG